VTQHNPGQSPREPYQPSRRELLRPVEYVGGAAIAAIFVGVIALVATRDWMIAIVGTGGVFIVVLMVLALLQMAIKPDALEQAELGDGQVPRAPGAPTDGEPGEPRGH
jgi:predicted lysophospholipase L1 biosynthesis ABC-type transport system permease subunit